MCERLARHRRHWFIGTTFAVVAAGAAQQASAGLMVYDVLAQERSMAVQATARAPGQPDVTDSDTEASNEYNPVFAGIEATAQIGLPNNPGSVTGEAHASQTLTYAPLQLFARTHADVQYTEQGGNTGGVGRSDLLVRFLQEIDAPVRLIGTMTTTFTGPDSGNRQAGSSLVLIDLDTPDPHGGSLVVFGRSSSSDFSTTDSFDITPGMVLAGHRYELRLSATSTRELLVGAPLGNDPEEYTGFGEVRVTLLVPEPATAALCLPGALLLMRRRARRAR